MVIGNSLEAALHYADLGYPVFPCIPNDKRPATEMGFYDATTDAETIERWWKTMPTANVAIATAGLVVIDVDEADNRWLADEPGKAADLAGSPICITPRGGRHYWFRQPDGRGWRNTASALAPKVDTRANGGYVLVPPSVVGGRAYQWCESCELSDSAARLPEPPPWLVELLDGAAKSGSRNNLGVQQDGELADGNIIPEGHRNDTLARLAGSMRRVGMTRNEILAALLRANADRCSPPLGDSEVRSIADSISRYEPDGIAVAVVENHYGQDAGGGGSPRHQPQDPGQLPESFLDVPGFIGDVMEYTNATSHRPQPTLALAAALALLGTLTGRKIRAIDNTRTNIYCFGVCQSGGGKDRAREVNKDILFHAGADAMIGPENFASHSGLVAAVEAQPAILFQLDEFGRLIQTMGNPRLSPHLFNIGTNLMRLYSSAKTTFKGDAYADPKKNKTIHQPHACVFGTTVKHSFYAGLTMENITDGLLSRLLIFESGVETVRKSTPQAIAIPARIIDVAKWWVAFNPGGNLNPINPNQRVIEPTLSARNKMAAIDLDADEAAEQLGEQFGSLWMRTGERAMKLALLRACSRDMETTEINGDDAEWGCELSRHLTKKMMWIASQWVGETEFEKTCKRIMRLVYKHGVNGVTMKEMNQSLRSIPPRHREDAIKSLEGCGELTRVVRRHRGAGRPVTVFLPVPN